MRLFCDQCGEEFSDHTLRADSKFCSYCGKALSDHVKEQSSHLFASSPKGSRSFPQENYGLGKKRKTDGDETEPKKEPARPKKQPASDQAGSEEITVLNQTSLDDNPENGETAEPRELGKGKRIRKLTQRYGDEFIQFSKPPKPKSSPIATPSTLPIKTTNNSLQQILNSSPTSGKKPLPVRAAESVPITVGAFRLPPPFLISINGAARPFRRDTLSFVLGGSQKVTFPYPRNRIDGPPYACLKEAEQELLPVSPGEHGVIVVKSLPETLDRKGFHVFRKNKGICEWIYLGKYKSTQHPYQGILTQGEIVVHSFMVSPEQWRAFSHRTKKNKVTGTLRNAWGAAWCEEKGIRALDDDMLHAFDVGILQWEAHVIECIDWDKDLFQQMAAV